MFRVFLLVVTAAVVVLLIGPAHLLDDPGRGAKSLVSDDGPAPTTAPSPASFLDRPALRVLDAPASLLVKQSGSLRVVAEPPARPGDTVTLVTAGAMGMGYNKVSKGVLDDDLTATLAITARDYIGDFRYWVQIPASGKYQSGQSASFTIAIQAPTPPQQRPDLTCRGEQPVKADGTPWECTYDDEFDGDELDRSYWVPQTGGTTTGTRSRYACAADLPETIAVKDGHLELSVVQLPYIRKCTRQKASVYAYGQVMHLGTFSQTYGKWEVRARYPDVREPGVQRSFWLWPKKNTYGSWPMSGEIDFAEHYSAKPDLDRPYLHYLPGSKSKGSDQNVTHADCPIKVGEFNTYGVEWEPGRITVLLNGEVCFVNDYSSVTSRMHGEYSPFDKPFYLSLNQAMGTIGNLYDPDVIADKVTTEVDYVRIWR